MLNTNRSHIEPKTKELLLERRHSICLEVSKKRRQSVASSIFIPKNHHHQTEPRLKEKFDSEKKTIISLRNKKCLALLTNKRRSIGRLISKMKLKCVAITNKNKCISKAKVIPTTLKHPKSYPIIKQTVSSEKIRCVVESLREDKITKSSTLYTDEKKTETSERNSVDSLLIENIKMELESKVGEGIGIPNDLILLQTQDNEHNEHNETKTDQSVTNSNEEKIVSHVHYSSINRVDNFIVMVDANAGHVEIKYAGPLSSLNKVEAFRNPTEIEVHNPAHNKTHENINEEYGKLSCMETNQITTNMKVMEVAPLYQSNACCANISTKCRDNQIKNNYICMEDISRPKLKQSNQGDLSLEKATLEKHPAKAVHRPSSAELIYKSSMSRCDTIEGVLNIQQTAYGPETHLPPAQQRRLACYQQFLDQSRIFNENSTSQPSSHNHNSIEITERNSNLHQKHQTAVDKFQPESFHRLSFRRRSAQFQTPSISPIDCQWVASPPKDNFGNPKPNELFSGFPTNAMSSELAYASCKNTNYPSVHIFPKHLPRSLRETRHANAFDKSVYFHHRIDQIQPTYQNTHQHQVCFPRQHYPQQMSFPSQMCNQLDLPKQFYNPLHQSFLSSPYHSRSSLNMSLPNDVYESKETGRLNCRNNIFPNVQFKPLQTNLPLTPPLTARCFSSEQSTSFPSPNWTNTFFNGPSLPLKVQPCWNIPPHLYPVQSRIPPETEIISHLHAPGLSAISTNALKDRTHNSICFSTPMHAQSLQQFPLNYI